MGQRAGSGEPTAHNNKETISTYLLKLSECGMTYPVNTIFKGIYGFAGVDELPADKIGGGDLETQCVVGSLFEATAEYDTEDGPNRQWEG